MDGDENTELVEMDPEMDIDKRARRSSILKPQKPRNPLSTLDFSEANPDNTLSRATRRVSFASSNFVKPFAADPEKNTIWDNTYEEEVNHTDSTKSSYDQTQGTKTDFLNTTSTHSATTDLLHAEINPFNMLSLSAEGVNIDVRKEQGVSDVNPGESLVSFARKLRSKSIEQYDVQTMDFTMINKTKLIESTMEMTCLTDKENVNPLINDLSLVIPGRSCLRTASATKYFIEEDMDFTKSIKLNEDVNLNKSINRNDVMVNTKKRESVMEFTCLANEENEDLYLEKQNKRQGISGEDIKTNTIYFDSSVNAMELTNVNENRTVFFPSKSKRRTIFFNEAETEGNMDFTIVSTNDNVNIEEDISVTAGAKNNTHSKNKTIIGNQSENDMELTTSYTMKIHNGINKKQETLNFNNSGDQVRIMNSFAIQKNAINESKSKSVYFDKLECDMEFTTISAGKNDTAGNSSIAQVDGIEVTMATETIEKQFLDKSEFASDMELNSTLRTDLTKLTQCDMSLSQNASNNSGLCVSPDAKTCNNSRKIKETMSSNSLLTVKDDLALFDSPNTSKSENVQQISSNNTANHQGVGNDIPTCNVSKTNDIKRHILDSVDADAIKKRRVQQSLSLNEKSGIENVLLESNELDQSLSLAHEPDLKKAQPNLQTSTLSSSNILYTEPMKLKLKNTKFVPASDLSGNLNLDGTLNMDHISTPAMSFHMNLSGMSPCTEDTQQLIHATFSKPETLKILNRGAGSSFEEPENQHTSLNNSQDFIKMSNESLKDNKSCFLADITPLVLVPEEFDNSGNDPLKITERHDDSRNSSGSSNIGDYTFRSQAVLTNIEKHLLIYEPVTPKVNFNLARIKKQFGENCRLISSYCKSKVLPVDLEAKHNQDMEETLSSVNDAVLSTSEDSGVIPTLKLIAPKSIPERIRQTAESCKKYWKVDKLESDYCYFYTLFDTMPFKVHIHPELGMVYSVETYNNLSDLSGPICHYQFKLLQQKLKWENLFSVLGANFDVFAVLDYVYMSVEEMVKFHLEYTELVKKYGKSHHFRMNPDHSVTFEILNLRQIICWIITVNLSVTSQVAVMRDDIRVVHKVGKIVNEDHIKTIAENTPKGLNFLRNFIENVDDYVIRMGRKINRTK